MTAPISCDGQVLKLKLCRGAPGRLRSTLGGRDLIRNRSTATGLSDSVLAPSSKSICCNLLSAQTAISRSCVTFSKRPCARHVFSSFSRLRHQHAYRRRDREKHSVLDAFASLRSLQVVPGLLPLPVLPHRDPYTLC